MAGPKKGEPGYAEYREAYNARRKKRRQDPEYVKRANARAVAQRARRKAEDGKGK
ncbi:hypothetical protein [Mycobacterium avium]|uniref:hypothetical protein n=1 Tax=Mycobacterium avium TaxID=1764 RepID=UPI0015945B06|nr:hypothetical protein [Mycobacterium avium]